MHCSSNCQTFSYPNRKGRRKADKDPPSSDGTPGPPYLDPVGARFPTQFVTPALLPAYVRLPQGVDQDEWLATHSEYMSLGV